MNRLEHNSRHVYQDFVAGYHVVCRTEDDTWGGVSSGHITEQTLM